MSIIKIFAASFFIFSISLLIPSKIYSSSNSHLAPNELETIQVTSDVTFLPQTSNFSSTFYVSGPLVENYNSLTGQYIDYIISYGSPSQRTVNFNLTKNNGIFSGMVQLDSSGCIDLKSGPQTYDTYIASFCFTNNVVGENQRGILSGPSTAAPFKYVTGQGYIWGQSNHQQNIDYYFTGFNPNVENSKFAVQTLTLAFNKNSDPYYLPIDQDNNFKPTNTYWVLQNGLLSSQLIDIKFFFKENSFVSCQDNVAKIGIFSNLLDDPNAKFIFAPNHSSDCWFDTGLNAFSEPFPDKNFLLLMPALVKQGDVDYNGYVDIDDLRLVITNFSQNIIFDYLKVLANF